MIGDDLLFARTDHAALALRPRDHAVHRFIKLVHGDLFLIAAGGKDCGFVHQVGEVGAGEARCLLGQDLEAGVLVQGLALGMHFQDGAAATNVGVVEYHRPVETARPQ